MRRAGAWIFLWVGCWMGAATLRSASFEPITADDGDGDVVVFKDQRIDESSGLAAAHSPLLAASDVAAARAREGWWTHNDSGDIARLFLLDRQGATVVAVNVDGAKAVDWEDLTGGVLQGQPVLWIGDVGDNGGRRSQVEIYLVDEPPADVADGATVKLRRKWELRYEDGPRDCEAIGYDNQREELLLIAKGRLPFAGVYAVKSADMLATEQPLTVKRIATINLPMVTGMDIRRDGLQMAVCTYFQVFTYDREAHESWDQVVQRAPKLWKLPSLKQVEAVAYDRTGQLWVTSEGSPLRLAVLDNLAENK